MSSPLMQIEALANLIRQLHKIDSKLNAGQIIAAYRENRRVIAELETCKARLIEEAEKSAALNANPDRGALSKEG